MQASLSATPSIRLRTSYGFWIVALLPGIGAGLRGMLVWGAIVFGSVVLHELANALTGMSGGRRAVIVLHPLGARTEFEPTLPARRSTWSTLAGPASSLAVGALLFVARRAMHTAPAWLAIAMWVNLGWGVLNMLPVIPFAGGRLLMDRLGKTRPTAVLLISSATTAIASTLGVVTIRHTGFAVLFVSVSFLSLFELAKVHEQIRAQHIDAQLAAARSLVLNYRYAEAIAASGEILANARDFETRNAALTTLAWAHLGDGQPRAAMAALRKVLPAEGVDPYTLAAVLRASGQRDHAVQTLERARTAAALSREAARLLIDLYAERGDLERAFSTTLDHLRVLGPDDACLVVRALEQAEDFQHALTLSRAIGKAGAPISLVQSVPEDVRLFRS